jgi:hypothetical protein
MSVSSIRDALKECKSLAGPDQLRLLRIFGTESAVSAGSVVVADGDKDIVGARKLWLGTNGASGFAGELDIQDGTNPGNSVKLAYGQGAGAKNGASVVAVEYGLEGVLHKTVLTCTATPLTFGDEAGQGQYGGVKVYDFPAGLISVLGATIKGAITLTAPAIATWDGDVGLGVEAPTDHQDVANKTGSVLQATSTTTAVGRVATTNAASAATALSESGARWLDGRSSAVDLFLNLLIDDNGAHDNTITGAFTGTIEFAWINLGGA